MLADLIKTKTKFESMVILFLERKKHFINVKIFFPYTYIYHGEVVTRKMDIGTDMMLRTGLYDTRMSRFYEADFPSLFVGLGEYRGCYISPLSFSVSRCLVVDATLWFAMDTCKPCLRLISHLAPPLTFIQAPSPSSPIGNEFNRESDKNTHSNRNLHTYVDDVSFSLSTICF